ncbi:MAG: MFS transporter [Panacagrimonas sp.]
MTRSYRLVLLASLYLAQGLPFGFFTQALPVLLRERGLSLAAIGASGLLFLPWALKFLWAPLVDHSGSRKAWILSLQAFTVCGALALAFVDFDANLLPIFAALVLFNLLAATQDVATDGLAVRMLGPAERGLANGIQVGAYRFGMILGGGFLLWVFARAGWSTMFVGMATILLLTSVPALFLPACSAPESGVRTGGRALLIGWLHRLRVPGLPTFIVLICVYKFGDAMASSLVGPFMHDVGLSKEEIAVVKGSIGSAMGLAGAALGGWLAFRFGRRPALIACGLLQTLSLLLYVGCAMQPDARTLIYVASTAEHLLGGMATVALFTLMMDASDPDHAGTDYTLLACAIVLSGGLAGLAAGLLGDAFGYASAFALSCLLSGAGCLALVLAIDRGRGPVRLSAVWLLKSRRSVQAEGGTDTARPSDPPAKSTRA